MIKIKRIVSNSLLNALTDKHVDETSNRVRQKFISDILLVSKTLVIVVLIHASAKMYFVALLKNDHKFVVIPSKWIYNFDLLLSKFLNWGLKQYKNKLFTIFYGDDFSSEPDFKSNRQMAYLIRCFGKLNFDTKPKKFIWFFTNSINLAFNRVYRRSIGGCSTQK